MYNIYYHNNIEYFKVEESHQLFNGSFRKIQKNLIPRADYLLIQNLLTKNSQYYILL